MEVLDCSISRRLCWFTISIIGKGALGDTQMAWFKEHLLDPYARAMADITSR
jgi:hypothetical protein